MTVTVTWGSPTAGGGKARGGGRGGPSRYRQRAGAASFPLPVSASPRARFLPGAAGVGVPSPPPRRCPGWRPRSRVPVIPPPLRSR